MTDAGSGLRRSGCLLEKAPLGTAGALTVAREMLDPRFLMMNGDAFFDINLRALDEAAREGGATATLALRAVPDAGRYGRVIEEKGKVTAFLEKDPSRPGPGIINGGIYALKREILDLVSALPSSLEQDVFPALVERGEIRGKAFDGYFLDIGLPETLEQGRRELPETRRRPAAFFDRDALIDRAARPEALGWRTGALEAIRALNDRGAYVFVLGGADEGGLSGAIGESLARAGAHVDRFYGGAGFASGLASGAAGGPNPFAAAIEEWPIVREKSFFIGAARATLRPRARRASPPISPTGATSPASSKRASPSREAERAGKAPALIGFVVASHRASKRRPSFRTGYGEAIEGDVRRARRPLDRRVPAGSSPRVLAMTIPCECCTAQPGARLASDRARRALRHKKSANLFVYFQNNATICRFSTIKQRRGGRERIRS